MPTTLHVVIQELCPHDQNIHHAELLDLVRALECFRHAVFHVDSASAIATFQEAFTLQTRQLHRHPQPALCRRIRNLPHVDVNRVVKIKGHDNPHSLPDLQCYHALGNAAADKAAEDVCLTCYSALTTPWL